MLDGLNEVVHSNGCVLCRGVARDGVGGEDKGNTATVVTSFGGWYVDSVV